MIFLPQTVPSFTDYQATIMAANAETSTPQQHNKWYQDDVTEVNEPISKLLENYSKVPSGKVVEHMNTTVSILLWHGGSIHLERYEPYTDPHMLFLL